MRFSGTGGFTVRLLVVSATIGLAAHAVGTDWRAPQLDSVLVAGDLSGDDRVSTPPAVVDTLGERIAPDRPSHRALLAIVFGGVCAVLALRPGFSRLVPEAPRIRISQISPRRGRAPPATLI